jgi:hypothetical protein
MFLGQVVMAGAKELRKVKALNEYCFFAWLAFQDLGWTSDRLLCHSLHNNGSCALCCQKHESIAHVLLTCGFSREIWFKVLAKFRWHQLAPGVDLSPRLVDPSPQSRRSGEKKSIRLASVLDV